MSEINYPYSDEYMIYNESTKRYVLTNEYVFAKMGIDLTSAINERNVMNPQALLNRFLEEVSDDIYEYIHTHSIYNELQDYYIAVIPSLRGIIQKAMDKQLMYSRLNGLLGYSSNKDVQSQAICPKAKDILNTVVPELGVSILYRGM